MDAMQARDRRVESPEPGDVLILGRGVQPHHAGVLVAPGHVLHASRKAGVCVQPLAVIRQVYPLVRAYRWP
jgi:cell wall-associated NlpC family hydrolase